MKQHTEYGGILSLPGKKNNSQVLKFSVSQTGSSKHSLSCRVRDQFPGTEMEKYALFTYESLKKTKCREFVPSRDEIEALISRQEMTSTVYCHGGGSCKITINSHTTAGEVRRGDRTNSCGTQPVSLYMTVPASSSSEIQNHRRCLHQLRGHSYPSEERGGKTWSLYPTLYIYIYTCMYIYSVYELHLVCREVSNCSSLFQEKIQERLTTQQRSYQNNFSRYWCV